MSARKLVAIFKVDQREFSLYLHQYEFILELKPVFQRNRQQPRQNAWLAFADEPTLEDVAENINAFEVMQQTRSHLVKYISFNINRDIFIFMPRLGEKPVFTHALHGIWYSICRSIGIVRKDSHFIFMHRTEYYKALKYERISQSRRQCMTTDG